MSSDLKIVNTSVYFTINVRFFKFYFYFFFLLHLPSLSLGRQSLGQQTPFVLRLEEEDCELFESVFQLLYQNTLFMYAALFLLHCWDWYAVFVTERQHLLGREVCVNLLLLLLLSNFTPLNSISTFRKYQN